MRRIAILTLLPALALMPARAADKDETLTGSVEVGYREVSLSGNEDKYREDLNLGDGAVRLFAFDLAYRPENGGFFDEITLDASGLGGEPHTTARFRARKAGRFDLRARYRSSDFFYRDAGYFFRDGGDLHTWDARRELYDVDLKIKAADWVTFRLGADRVDRDGGSESSRDVQGDQFALAAPVDQTASAYWAGADFRFGWADLTLEQRVASYENRRLLEAGATDGEVSGEAFLDSYSVVQVQDADAPVSRISFGGSPWDRLSFSFGFARVDAELDYDVEGDWDGVDFNTDPFQTTLANTGRVERTYDLWDAEVTLGILDDLDVSVDFSRRSYEQEGSIDYLEEQIGGEEEGLFSIEGNLRNELELEAVRVAAAWRATRELTLTAGVGRQTRDAAFELAGPAVETERTLYRAGARYRRGSRLDLRVDFETGSDDEPYTRVSPTDVDRLRFRLRVQPKDGLRLDFRFRDESRENDLAYPLGLPTDDVPPATEISTAKLDVTAWGVSAQVSASSHVDLSLGYDRTEIDADADLVFVTGSTFVPAFDIFTTLESSAYVAEQDALRAQAVFRLGEAWSAGLLAVVTSNDGTFPIDWDRYRAHVAWQHGSGLFVRLALERYELSETNPYAGDPAARTPAVNDYEADLATASLGFRF